MLKIYQLRLKQNTFDVTLKYRGVSVRVAFVDGNNYREIPAKCYTRDPFKQRAIENSQMFKDKEIVLERAIEEESDRKKAAGKQTASQQGPAVDAPADAGLTDTTTGASADDSMAKKVFDSLSDAILFVATNYQAQVQTANEARNFLKEKGIKATIKQG